MAAPAIGRTSIVCQCMSIRPGISVRPLPLIRHHGHAGRVGNGRARDRLDDVARHENMGRPRKLATGAVEDANILEEHARRLLLRMRARYQEEGNDE